LELKEFSQKGLWTKQRIKAGGSMEGKILKRLHYRFILGALMILLITSPSFSQAPAPDAFSIQRIEVTETASGPRVAIEGSKSFKYNVFRLTDPLRVVIEVPRAQLGKIAGPVEVKDGTINVIQNRQIEDPQKQGARIEIGLDHLVEYDVVPEGNFLYLNFRKPPIPPPKEVKEEEKKEPEKKEAAPAAPLRKAKSLKEIEVSVKVDGVKVDIKGDGLIPEYKSFELASPTRLVVDLADLSNASGKKEINVGSRLLKHIRIGQHPDKVRLVFDVPEAKLPPYQLTREGQELKLTLGEVKKEAPKEEKAPVAEGPKPIPHEAVIILSGIDYWFAKGNEFANASRWQEAREAYTRAIKLNPKYAPAFYARGVARSWLGDYRQAIRDYDKAIELNYSRDDLAYYHRGVAYSKLEDHSQAIRNYDKAIQLEPKYAPAFYARGVAYFKLGDHRQAIRNYDRALELDPKGADTYYNRGIAYGKLGDSYRETMDYKTAAKLGYKPAQDFLKSKGISW
jgi:tetratricopeptide (TPR) repeat protein